MKKILIIEDSADMASNIQYVLSNEGYLVFTANTGVQGIEMAKDMAPDLLLVDIMLPDIQGGDAVHKIKKHPSCGDVPVIFLTGLMSESQEDNQGVETIIVDGQAYPALGKPFDFPRLLKYIREFLD
jgi:CheY-like chemotaxis protein